MVGSRFFLKNGQPFEFLALEKNDVLREVNVFFCCFARAAGKIWDIYARESCFQSKIVCHMTCMEPVFLNLPEI